MSMPSNPRSRRAPQDLEVVTHWPTVVLVITLTAVFLAGPLGAAIWFSRPSAVAAKDSPAVKPMSRTVAETFLPWMPASTPPAAEPQHHAAIPDNEPLLAVAKVAPLPPPPLAAIRRGFELRPYEREVAKVSARSTASTKASETIEAPAKASGKGAGLSQDQQRELLAKAVPHVNWIDDEEWRQAEKKCCYPKSWEKLPSGEVLAPAWLAELTQRPDLRGLPVRQGADCQMDVAIASRLTGISRLVREGVTRSTTIVPTGSRRETLQERPTNLESVLAQCKEKGCDYSIPLLIQMLQAQSQYMRLKLVATLREMAGQVSSGALARLALYDIDPEIRKDSIEALKNRPKAEFRELLCAGFRYPWPPVADNAAQAVAELQDSELTLRLAELLELPDPRAPFRDTTNRWVKQELVGVNHLKNCFLCHARSTEKVDSLRGFVPQPGGPLVSYFEDKRGYFVRADVTYLRQDFSVLLPVSDGGRWPDQQRFDFLVRTRELTADELKAWRASPPASTYPQREAVLAALRNLTGEDVGTTANDWRRLLWHKRKLERAE